MMCCSQKHTSVSVSPCHVPHVFSYWRHLSCTINKPPQKVCNTPCKLTALLLATPLGQPLPWEPSTQKLLSLTNVYMHISCCEEKWGEFIFQFDSKTVHSHLCVYVFCISRVRNQAIKKMSVPSRSCGWFHREGEGGLRWLKPKRATYYQLHNVSLSQIKLSHLQE